jgi:hypothetical protein
MLKPFHFMLLFITASGAITAHAQTNGSDSARAKDTQLLNENYLTPTGEAVSRPGISQGAPTTNLDRRIEEENNRLDKSICSNCN